MNPTLLDVCKVSDTLTTIEDHDAAIIYANGFKILHNGPTLEIAGLELRVQDVVRNPELLETYLKLFKKIGGEDIFPYAYLRACASNTQAELDTILAQALSESSKYPMCPGRMYVPSAVFPMYVDVHVAFTEFTICEFCLKHGCKRDTPSMFCLVDASKYDIGDRFSCDCDVPHARLLETEKAEIHEPIAAEYPDICTGCGIRFRYVEHEPVCEWCAYKQSQHT